MKLKRWVVIVFAAVVVIAGAGWYWYQEQPTDTPTTEKTTIGQTATLYLHGYSGGAGSTNTLIRHAEQSGATKVLTATVAKNGKVSWQGNARHVSKPIVQVIFQDNVNPDYAKLAGWLTTINRELYQRYGVRQVNFVAHSMGNMAVMFYATQNSDHPKLPKMRAYVAIAGHFDENYATLARMRDRFPKNVKVLNIYGDVDDGSDSDGRVANNSSRSLQYLVEGRAASYQEKEFVGKKAQHSALHENPQVAKAVDNFIW